MGDFTSEKLYMCAPSLAADLIDAEGDEAAFEAMAALHDAASDPVEFRSYSYEQNVYLPVLLSSYADVDGAAVIVDLNEYQERPNIVYRASKAGQADAIYRLLDAIGREPERLVLGLHKMYARHPKIVAEFNITGDALRQLLHASPEGGYHPGSAPEEITGLREAFSPKSNLIDALCYGFGFLKTIAPVYRAAHAQGQCVLHLQIYGT